MLHAPSFALPAAQNMLYDLSLAGAKGTLLLTTDNPMEEQQQQQQAAGGTLEDDEHA